MMENTKCECGHQNPVGTLLCESCGKPLQEMDEQELLEMRYDGMARRSQRANKSWIDHIWSFFSSVKIAVYLIVITLIVASLGTIYPQQSTFIGRVDFAKWYADNYGWTGKLYYYLGLSTVYESWWFKALLVMIGTSLVVCSLDRVLPLYRALSKQKLRKHPQFLMRQKVAFKGMVPQSGANHAVQSELTALSDQTGHSDQASFSDQTDQAAHANDIQDQTNLTEGAVSASSQTAELQQTQQTEGDWMAQMQAALKKKRYRVHVEDGALLAEKGRFSRWGPYINHIGLILFLLAVLARGIPGWHLDEHIWVLEQDIVKLENTPYYVKNEKFTLDFYDEDEIPEAIQDQGKTIAKTYRLDAVLYECTDNCDSQEPVLEQVHAHDIEVNYPLKYKDLWIYLVDYEPTRQLLSMNLTLKKSAEENVLGQFELDMRDPQKEYQIDAYTVMIEDYYPELIMREGAPATNSRDPINPAFIMQVTGPDIAPQGERYLFIPMMGVMTLIGEDGFDLTAQQQGEMEFTIQSEDDVVMSEFRSFLNIRKDVAIMYIWIGGAISMIGLIMGFYWQHRRIWLRVDKGQIQLGAHTNKNWFALRKELADTLKRTGIEVDPRSLSNEVKSK
ncbi:cytochrome c biogenesis protein ResB [Marinicrinis sediminis]|uniref:Cytochrome c biogenesis protein ResB n=1 Tax=Marinicrinis sediminis TaxID=1652465 RepID=A0ABW5RE37_9BACL